MIDVTNCVLLSKISADQTLRLTLESQPIGKLANGEVLVRVEAAPINPSDIGGMLSSANLASARLIGTGSNRALVADMQAVPSAMLARRIGSPIQIGNEGAGTVIAAADDCAALIGKRVAMLGGAMFAQYRRIAASDCLLLPDSLSSEDGAALFVNPLTALAMVETARREGHGGIVHTAAASSLGRMLCKICRDEGIPLVNCCRHS
jgi:NADPH2:quinone reductase